MGKLRANLNSLQIATQARLVKAERERDELRKIVHGLVTEQRHLLAVLRPHVRAEGLPLIDEFIRVLEPEPKPIKADNPLRGNAPVQVYTESDLKAASGG